MKQIVGIRFKNTGKVYYFDPGDLELKKGQHVIVDTVSGEEYAEVAIEKMQIEDEKLNEPLKSVVRVSTEKDDKLYQEFKSKEDNAFQVCL